jgi:hypothetical protein
MMQQTDPLAGLRDIHLPEAVSLWPLAVGWWMVLGAVVAVLLTAELLRRRRLASLRAAALRELNEFEKDWQRSKDSARLAFDLSSLLRRVALARFPRAQVAALAGVDWSTFLRGQGGSGPELGSAVEAMGEVVYGPGGTYVEQEQGAGWIDAARRWIRRQSRSNRRRS